jgi:hypothetical protein
MDYRTIFTENIKDNCVSGGIYKVSTPNPIVVREKNMVKDPEGLGTQNDCAGESKK